MKPLLLFVLIALSCSYCTDSVDDEQVCYSFDLRQCNGDPWNSDVTRPFEPSELVALLSDYLNDNAVPTNRVTVDMTFHRFVCEACVVCPEGPRFYVELNASDTTTLINLDLLNTAPAECDLLIN